MLPYKKLVLQWALGPVTGSVTVPALGESENSYALVLFYRFNYFKRPPIDPHAAAAAGLATFSCPLVIVQLFITLKQSLKLSLQDRAVTATLERCPEPTPDVLIAEETQESVDPEVYLRSPA